MRKILLSLILSTLCLSAFAQAEKCYARMEGDTLRLGNSLIERSFLWNDGALETLSLSSKDDAFVLKTKGLCPDFRMGKGDVTDARMEQTRIPATERHPAYLLVSVQYTQGELEVRREYRLFEGVPAIGCDTWVRGSFRGILEGGRVNAADHKNIESSADMVSKAVSGTVLDQLSFPGAHWHGKAVRFRDVTDWNNNLVQEEDFIAYRKLSYKGNLLFVRDGISGNGFFFLKEAPCSDVQLGNPSGDFTADFGRFQVTGAGILPEDIKKDEWTRLYGCVTGVFGPGELAALSAVRAWQKTDRLHLDVVMMNTWGDRSQDSKVNEEFCLSELELASRLGIAVFQIDDGWQSGKSPNSKVAKGSFRNIWDNPDYWTPDPVKYPRGLDPVVDRARALRMEVGLWYNPSVQNDFADWEKDAEAIIGLWKKYGICIFKIDGLQIPTKQAENNLRRLFDRVREATDDAVVFNLDATAGRRAGYHYFGEYGNIFLENRYTDWGNYYPYHTLRNLWMLSRYVPAEKLQTEFLNPWRNADKYEEGDPFAPANYDFGYLASISFAGQPLAWMEASNLPEEAFATGDLIRAYREISPEFHSGIILPIGEEPSGRSWTGFQSIISSNEGYLLIYREDNPAKKARIRTWLPEGRRVRLVPVLGSGRSIRSKVGADGCICLKIREKNSSKLYKYLIK